MDRSATKHPVLLALTFAIALGGAAPAIATKGLDTLALAAGGAVVTNPNEPHVLLDSAALEELIGRVALYPDALLAIVLPASTYPLQIVQAARYLEAHKSDSALEPSAEWDDSIIALLNYPEVIELLNTDLDWTWQLGEAVINQQADVVVAVEHFRERAHAAGNLESDEHKIVNTDNGAIEITSAETDAVYVPYYEPAEVVYPQTVTAYHYYPRRYPLYYYPYSAGHSFYSGAFWGVTAAFTIGWFTNHLHFHPYGYRSHPYYGHRYHRSNFRRHGLHASRRHLNSPHRHRHNYHGDYWNSAHRFGNRPRHLRNSGRRNRIAGTERASNGLIANRTVSRRNSLAGRRNTDRRTSANAIERASNGLLANGTRNRNLRGNNKPVRSGRRGNGNATQRASNGLIANNLNRNFARGNNAARNGRRGNANRTRRATQPRAQAAPTNRARRATNGAASQKRRQTVAGLSAGQMRFNRSSRRSNHATGSRFGRSNRSAGSRSARGNSFRGGGFGGTARGGRGR